jgi:phosphatidate phosphatase APP1
VRQARKTIGRLEARRPALWIARRVERGLERIGRRRTLPVLEPYLGHAEPGGVVLRGRVLTHLRRAQPEPEQSRWTNLRQMLSLFLTDEVAGVAVRAAGAEARSDAEGYVTLHVPGTFAPGWAELPAALPDQPPVACRALVPAPEAETMVISDIDDTVIETGAHSLPRNLWTTFTGSALSRRAHPDAVALMRGLSDGGRVPVFYVSSSPWNLHHFLETLFAREGVPPGPMFLRDLGVTEAGVGRSHGDHKGEAIDAILAANPDLSAILLGDTGQHDAAIYRAAVERHPGRVRAVGLREPAPGAGRDAAACMAAIEAAGVPCFHAPSFDGARTYWGME